MEVAADLGANRRERSDEWLGYLNGSRPSTLATQMGKISLAIPKLHVGSIFPATLEPRRRIDQAKRPALMEA